MRNAGTGRAQVVRLAEVAAEEESERCAKRARGEGGRARAVRWEGGRWLVEDVEEDAGGEGPDGDRRDGNGDWRDGHSGGGDTDDGATVDSGEREERRRGVWECEADIMERAEARRGYTVAAAWDEGAMIQLMTRMRNPTLQWRYGDG